MRLQNIKEGKIKLNVPAGRPWDAAAFFNPDAELTRDISVSTTQVFRDMTKGELRVCDALSGTGARGLRYAKEVKGLKEVVLNDKNPVSVKFIKKNISLNKLGKKCTPSHCDANVMLSGRWFPIIDIDPFGPPVNFLDSAARSIMNKGMIAVTATDTSALAGAYPQACLRKYGIISMKTDYYAELGVRILISSIITACARHEKAFRPILSFASGHYYRVFGTVSFSRTDADNLLGSFGYVSHCFSCGNRIIGRQAKCEHCSSDMKTSGPLYLGAISDKTFCQAVYADLQKRKFRHEKEDLRLVQLVENEADLSPFYYDIHVLAKLQKAKIPRINDLIEKLHKRGFVAERTHFCSTAVKTDARFDVLCALLGLC